MNTMYGITGIAIKSFVLAKCDENIQGINNFLDEYNGNIIDIQTNVMPYGATKVVIIYKAKEM